MKKITFLSGLIMFALIGCTSLEKTYQTEVNEEIQKWAGEVVYEIFTEEEIVGLPEPVRRYLRYCGYIGKEKMVNARVVWSDSYIKMSPGKKWMRLKTEQFNSVPEPMRAAYMKARLWGFIPFEGRDYYGGGNGSMRGKLIKLFTVINADDHEIAQSALITLFAETLFIPNYALQDYIEWIPVDSLTAAARLRHGGMDVSGLFFFNERGEFIRFETNDRYYTDPDGGYRKVKFSAVVDQYKENKGVLIPASVRAVWHLDEGDYEYWRGTISDINYNIH
jgi:hypothetical protein